MQAVKRRERKMTMGQIYRGGMVDSHSKQTFQEGIL